MTAQGARQRRPELAPGDRIRHDDFGDGRVNAVTGEGAKRIAQCSSRRRARRSSSSRSRRSRSSEGPRRAAPKRLRGWPGRAAVAVAVPLFVLFAVGRLDLTAYATFGAFTALYGRNEPYRVRVPHAHGRCARPAAAASPPAPSLAVAGEPLPLVAVALVIVVGGGTLFVTCSRWFLLRRCSSCSRCWSAPPSRPRRPMCCPGVAVGGCHGRLRVAPHHVRLGAPPLSRPRRALAGGRAASNDLRRPPGRRRALRDPRVWLTVGQNVVGVLIAGGRRRRLRVRSSRIGRWSAWSR